MRLWVGLGNPEPGMLRNRHNIGFMAIDTIAAKYGFSPWRQRFKGVTAEGAVGGERILALKPLTYMNASGESVQAAASFYKLEPSDITAFHDELDLAQGKVRVKRNGGAAGHNALRSMDRILGTPRRDLELLGWFLTVSGVLSLVLGALAIRWPHPNLGRVRPTLALPYVQA